MLEIGAGTGVNFKYYNHNNIDSIWVVDQQITKTAKIRASNNMRFMKGDAVKLPFDNDSFDTVVETLLLCSVDGEQKAVEEIYRVLKPGGQFIHIDHGLPHGKLLKGIFNFAAPAWRWMSQSCRINKTYKYTIEKESFVTQEEITSGSGIFYGAISIKLK